ncbi:hypothetical protein DINM_004195 [Dirofilaria immitis]|nr:hypothetical protein [Dirofilaria immitis]
MANARDCDAEMTTARVKTSSHIYKNFLTEMTEQIIGVVDVSDVSKLRVAVLPISSVLLENQMLSKEYDYAVDLSTTEIVRSQQNRIRYNLSILHAMEEKKLLQETRMCLHANEKHRLISSITKLLNVTICLLFINRTR